MPLCKETSNLASFELNFEDGGASIKLKAQNIIVYFQDPPIASLIWIYSTMTFATLMNTVPDYL